MHHHMQVTGHHHGRVQSNHANALQSASPQEQQQIQQSTLRVNQHTQQKQKHIPLTNQMQKIRQQHQHLNNNNTKCNQQQQQQQQSPQQEQQQQQHNQHQHQQQLQSPPHQQVYHHPRYDSRQNHQPHPRHINNHVPNEQHQQQQRHQHQHHHQQQQQQQQQLHHQQQQYPQPYGPPHHSHPLNNLKSVPFNYSEPPKVKYNNNSSSGRKYLPSQRRPSSSHGNRHHSKNYEGSNCAFKKGTSLATIVEYSPPASSHEGSQINGSSDNDNEKTSCTQMPADDHADQPGLGPVPAPTPAYNSDQDCNTTTLEYNGNISELDRNDVANKNKIKQKPNKLKDKTAMCLVNELARYNKIPQQYRLTGENGMAHCKTFTVTLKLGDEEYAAEGRKIKQAQHLAAASAMEKTNYPHPPPKVRRLSEGCANKSNVTPTVELNALAMKLGQTTYYVLDPNQPVPQMADMLVTPPAYSTPTNMLTPLSTLQTHVPYVRRNMNIMPVPAPANPPPHIILQQQRFCPRAYPPKYDFRYPIVPPMATRVMGPRGQFFPARHLAPTRITLFVGEQKFIGNGLTLQQAKHDAAAQALQVLKEQLPNYADQTDEKNSEDGEKKSPISYIHEIGIKRNMPVHFKVLHEEGPPHMKNFITQCTVGSIATEGEGNGKKLSKKRAAEKMLLELKKLPPIVSVKHTPNKRSKATGFLDGKTERRKCAHLNSLRDKSFSNDKENPITRLLQLQQSRKEEEPVFKIISKNGDENTRRSEFVIEVTAQGNSVRGIGNSKKLAKRNAAQNLLQLLENQSGLIQKSESSEQPVEAHSQQSGKSLTQSCPTITQPTIVQKSEPAMVATPVGLVPGILIQRQNRKHAAKRKDLNCQSTELLHKQAEVDNQNMQIADTKTATQQTLKNSNEREKQPPTDEGSKFSSAAKNVTTIDARMKSELFYLARLSGFEVEFSDYPKGNHKEFLSIVTLSTNPPQICHGVGSSSEESQNDAAKNALKILKELGLNNGDKK